MPTTQRKKSNVLSIQEREILMTDVAKNLYRSKTLEEMAKEYNVSSSLIGGIANGLRKPPYYLDTPKSRGIQKVFSDIANKIVKENPGLVKKTV